MAIIPADEKVFMVDKRTNTTYGGSAALQAMQEWYTMQDVADSVQPYKVFTTLLTQSGEDSPSAISSDAIQPLTIGVTYMISQNELEGDFTNVGAPNNNVGTYFIATGTTPTSWGTNPSAGVVELTYNTGAPVANVLENTIGVNRIEFNSDGQYSIYLNNAPFEKIFTPCQYVYSSENTFGGFAIRMAAEDIDLVVIQTKNAAGDFRNGILYNTPIEIRVYN